MNLDGKLRLDARAERANKDAAEMDVHLRQLESLRAGVAISILDKHKIIQVAGEDAEAFLQGQISSDVRELSGESRAQYSSYSTAKGRMLASFLVWRIDGAYYLAVSADLADYVAKRLSMFVLRSKVKVSIADNLTLIGLAGEGALDALAVESSLASSAGPREMVQVEPGLLIGLPGAGWALVVDEAGAALVGEKLTDSAGLISSSVWEWRDIDAGIPWVRLATQEQFVPQMANMELIGGVSFKKGCYPGQEIVARSQYLGKLKRRLFKVAFKQSLGVGAKLYSPSVAGQSIGMVAAVCQVAPEQYEGLAVVQFQAWEEGIYADEAYTIRLQQLDLPYSLNEGLEN
ncbi:folate-binding protein YgfZ [Chromobacterium haemolyticum]|uniref:Folate-binding protein YgfZ n=1 Tax=Chromobacterium fluminis TaxID=3044269 RepID=A0ABX0LGA3_9NEIS|nr:folate-binding protein YgfZ [Chromobacterium haemolyticum]NHR08661.1 folate-binding protein YgfZ [Chromobacterium haemolyticum]